MTTVDERIAQFENMAIADPDNEMAHFSLGQAYLQAGRPAEAARSFERCLALNPEMSKAWQLAGEALLETGDTGRAVETLLRGWPIAARKGDVLPRDAMAELLQRLGAEVPELSTEDQSAAERLAEAGAFVCTRTGRPGTQLPEPPFRGPIGAWIREHISAETWRAWIGQGTKVINELRLDLSREEDQRLYDQHMYEFLGMEPDLVESLETK